MSFMTLLLLSNNATPLMNPPMFASFFAPAIIFAETASPSSACSPSSEGLITAIASKSSNPASLSFSAVAGPTPGRSSIVACGSSTSITSSSSSTFSLAVFSSIVSPCMMLTDSRKYMNKRWGVFAI